MNFKVFKYILLDLLRNKFILFYTALLMITVFSILYMGGSSSKGIITLLNLILMIVPLVCLVFGTIHFYNSREFIQFLLTQPVNRVSIFKSEYAAVSASLLISFLAGMVIPFLFFGFSTNGFYLLLAGVFLTLIFTSAAFLASVINKDRVKGIGLSILIWIYCTIVFDGIIFLIIYLFNDYPVDKVIMILTSANPVDLARLFMLLQTDASALMGITGAEFQKYFGSIWGMLISCLFLLVWIFLPMLISVRIFKRTNF